MSTSFVFLLLTDTKVVLLASGFLGVFTVPKICSLYSAQLTVIGKFPQFNASSCDILFQTLLPLLKSAIPVHLSCPES